MKKFLKQNWLKGLILLVLVASLAVGNFYIRSKFHAGECVQALDGYIWHVNRYGLGEYALMGWQNNAWGNETTMSKSVLEKKDDSSIPLYHQVTCPEYNLNLNVEEETAQPIPQNTEANNSTPNRIIAQINAFDDYLEYNLVRAEVDCIVLAVYNNYASTGQIDTQAFPNSKESYENTCGASYLDVAMNQKILIAEPELQSLRTLLTSYAEEVKTFSQYALDGGSQGSYIDSADKKMENLRTLSREEVLKLKIQYNLN